MFQIRAESIVRVRSAFRALVDLVATGGDRTPSQGPGQSLILALREAFSGRRRPFAKRPAEFASRGRRFDPGTLHSGTELEANVSSANSCAPLCSFWAPIGGAQRKLPGRVNVF
jgi:hypothetical protein